MKPEDHLQDWKCSPKVVDDFIFSGIEITKLVTRYFLFKNIEPNPHNLAIIRDEVLKFCVSIPKIKLLDISLAFELYKVNEDNNISAAHVIGLIKKYSASEFRKKLFKLYQDEPDDKLPEPAKEIQPIDLLIECFNWYKSRNEINLNTGRVYTSNFKLISKLLGYRLTEILEETYVKVIQEFQNKINTVRGYVMKEEIKQCINDVHSEYKDYLGTGRLNGKSYLRNEVRKAHLREMFEKHKDNFHEVIESQNNFIHS